MDYECRQAAQATLQELDCEGTSLVKKKKILAERIPNPTEHWTE